MTANAQSQPDLSAMRETMVASQLRPSAVSDTRVVKAMAQVAREAFLPAHLGSLAYRDTAVPLGRGRQANPPIASGRLLNEACLRSTDRVLLIGAAMGYTAALLARLAASVVAVEVDADLAEAARAALADVANVEVVVGPLPEGHAAGASYDVLVIDGAVESVPQALIDQIAIDGRVVTGLVDRGVTRLARGTRTAGGFGLADIVDCDCVILPGFAAPAKFSFQR